MSTYSQRHVYSPQSALVQQREIRPTRRTGTVHARRVRSRSIARAAAERERIYLRGFTTGVVVALIAAALIAVYAASVTWAQVLTAV